MEEKWTKEFESVSGWAQFRIVADKGHVIATVYERHGYAPVKEANLIIAAPTLAQKLAETVEWLEGKLAMYESEMQPLMLLLNLRELYADLQETLRKVQG
jgi:hypothetical protein